MLRRAAFPAPGFHCFAVSCSPADARRVRPGGLLLLAKHVEALPWPARAAQTLIELASVPVGGEHLRRRPIRHVRALALAVEDHDRYKLGLVERLAARKP
jgi:hypothetical protein